MFSAHGASQATICRSASTCSTVRARKYPWLEMQTFYPFSEEGIGRAVADAIAMKTVKSTIVPWPELLQ